MNDLVKVNKELKKLGVKRLEDTDTHVMRMEIKSASSDKKYIVSKRNTKKKRWECSCPGWIFHRNCKHLKTIVPQLENIPNLLLSKPKKLITNTSGDAPKIKTKKKKRKSPTKVFAYDRKILTFLWENKNRTMSEIAKELEISRKVVKGCLAVLQDLNLVVSNRSKWMVMCVCKRPKAVYAKGLGGNLATVLSFYDKRRNTKGLFLSYRKYEGKRGNEESWKQAAEMLFEHSVGFKRHLTTLDLFKLPADLRALNTAWKEQLKEHHPDRGGNKARAAKINRAYEVLKELI